MATKTRRISVADVHFFVAEMATARTIFDRLKEQDWRDAEHGEREKTVRFHSEIGDILVAQFDQTDAYGKCALCDKVQWGGYNVRNEVWAEAGLKQNDLAHAVCLARALGRPLTPEDFVDAPVNDIAMAMLPQKRE